MSRLYVAACVALAAPLWACAVIGATSVLDQLWHEEDEWDGRRR